MTVLKYYGANCNNSTTLGGIYIDNPRGVQKTDETKPNRRNQSKSNQTNFKPIIIGLHFHLNLGSQYCSNPNEI